MGKTEIYGTEFDLETAEGCMAAKNLVAKRLKELTKQKEDLEKQLDSCFYDFEKSQQEYTVLKRAGNEFLHCQRLLKTLDEKYKQVLARENADTAQAVIERVEAQSAALAAFCLKEIPAASRKLAFLATAVQENLKNIEDAAERAEAAGLKIAHLRPALERVIGCRRASDDWIKYLRLPQLDESMEILSYWPLPQGIGTFKDNPDIQDQVQNVLSSDDILKTAAVLFRQIEKREVIIRPIEEQPESYITTEYRPAWYERPRSEWSAIFHGRSITARKQELGDPVQFWLGLEERRRLNAFVHFLNADQREKALHQLPQAERQKYWDYLASFNSKDRPKEKSSD